MGANGSPIYILLWDRLTKESRPDRPPLLTLIPQVG